MAVVRRQLAGSGPRSTARPPLAARASRQVVVLRDPAEVDQVTIAAPATPAARA